MCVARVHTSKFATTFVMYTSHMSFSIRSIVVPMCFFSSFVLLTIPNFSGAALSELPCPDAHIANATDIAAGYPAGAYVCPNDYKTTGITPESGEAKQYLASLLKGGSCGPYRTTAEGLDPRFSICAARFMKDLRAKNGSFYIVSMFRSAPHQAYLCGGGCGRVNGPCAAAGSSKHQQGLAIDISNGQYIVSDWVHQMAVGYGVRFPIRGDSGHMEPIPGSNCADPNFKPTDTVGNLTPSSALTNAIRRALGMPQQPPPPSPQMSPTPTQPSLTQPPPLGTQNTTALPVGTCAPQFYCSGSTYYYRSSSCVDQMYQTCQYGCANSTTCALGPAASSTNQNTNTNTNTIGTSTYDLIGQYANFGTIDIATATPITLNPNTGNATALQPPPPQSLAYGPAGVIVQPSPSQETFTSSDLSNSPLYGQPQSAFLASLNNIKNTLIRILRYLRPFGSNIPSQIYVE